MRAAVRHGVRDIRVEDAPRPTISRGEDFKEIKPIGVCGTDITSTEGKWKVNLPIIFGHEFLGTIAGLGGEVDGFSINDCVAEPNIVYGSCYFCQMSERNPFCQKLEGVIKSWSSKQNTKFSEKST